MVILWLIHAKNSDSRRNAFIVFSNQHKSEHSEIADLVSRQTVQVSDLSALVGRVLAYRGIDG